ncbi:unnamed protein product [Ceratitis capitata]|uniref:(Mediterranean fruit fly) hypothetical protein n=1 Tax=Ceratitis capitata TaxID=7213 RepID=A0A811U965_CERCA|nr:unnamed protein product [Ceratitis capitata]
MRSRSRTRSRSRRRSPENRRHNSRDRNVTSHRARDQHRRRSSRARTKSSSTSRSPSISRVRRNSRENRRNQSHRRSRSSSKSRTTATHDKEVVERWPNDKFYENNYGGRQNNPFRGRANENNHQQKKSSNYLDARREQRELIGIEGTADVWSKSPAHADVFSDDEQDDPDVKILDGTYKKPKKKKSKSKKKKSKNQKSTRAAVRKNQKLNTAKRKKHPALVIYQVRVRPLHPKKARAATVQIVTYLQILKTKIQGLGWKRLLMVLNPLKRKRKPRKQKNIRRIKNAPERKITNLTEVGPELQKNLTLVVKSLDQHCGKLAA